MNFKDFYKELIFDIDKPILRRFTAKQGDTKSRGFYVPVMQNGAIVDVVDESMTFYAQKPDGKRVFQNAVKEGGLFRIDLKNQVFAVAGVVKCELTLYGTDGEKITNKTFVIEVEPSLSDDSIVSEDERGVIDDALEFVEEYVPRLELIDIDSLEHYDSELKQNKVKISTVEKELNDYKRTIAGININQEAKQEASGYGIVNLPKNAANGQVSDIRIMGQTITQLVENGNFVNGLTGWSGPATLENGFAKLDTSSGFDFYRTMPTRTGKYYVSLLGYTESNAVIRSRFQSDGSPYVQFALGTTVGRHSGVVDVLDSSYNKINFYRSSTLGIAYIKDIMVVNLTHVFGAGNEPTKEEMDARITHYLADGTKSTIGSARISSADDTGEVRDRAYVTAVKDNKIVNLRSLPNGTKDEIRDGKLYKRTGEQKLKSGDITLFTSKNNVDYARINKPIDSTIYNTANDNKNNEATLDGLQIGTLVDWSNDTVDNVGKIFFGVGANTYFIGFEKNTTLSEMEDFLLGRSLTYQLAEPEIIPVQVSGSVVSHPNGTVYIDPATTVAGVYAGGITVTHTDLPIGTLDRITVIDYATGLETELDVSQAVISEDKLLFTHPDLSDGDIVFFEYEYDVETTQGEAAIQYYDSRYTIKDSVTGKFYKWEITVADGVPSIELVEV